MDPGWHLCFRNSGWVSNQNPPCSQARKIRQNSGLGTQATPDIYKSFRPRLAAELLNFVFAHIFCFVVCQSSGHFLSFSPWLGTKKVDFPIVTKLSFVLAKIWQRHNVFLIKLKCHENIFFSTTLLWPMGMGNKAADLCIQDNVRNWNFVISTVSQEEHLASPVFVGDKSGFRLSCREKAQLAHLAHMFTLRFFLKTFNLLQTLSFF